MRLGWNKMKMLIHLRDKDQKLEEELRLRDARARVELLRQQVEAAQVQMTAEKRHLA